MGLFTTHSNPQGYILQNRVTHIRVSPVSSTHAFRYSTLSLILGLDALESGQLDLASGLVFGYGGRWGRLLGLRSRPYLNTLSSSSIRRKLEDQLRMYYKLDGGETFQDAWIVTMPSILGFEGINPLTVYFCYKDQILWTIVLEIHNTFGESHVHLLQVGKDEDPVIAKGYDHQWTFRRQLHVSPFNDRSGFYTVSIKSPGGPPGSHSRDTDVEESLVILPAVCVRLYNDPDAISPADPGLPITTDVKERSVPPRRPFLGKLKLAAYLRTTSAMPLTTINVMRELVKQPFVLFLTLPRILYHAWILHFSKHLYIFPRPEPHPVITRMESAKLCEAVIGGGVGWQEAGLIESYARKLILNFLHRRTAETGISVVLTSSNPNMTPTKIPATGPAGGAPTLEILHLSPRIFTILLMCPSSEHSLLFGSATEEIFQVSSQDLFNLIFSSTTPRLQASFPQIILQNFRRSRVPRGLHITSPTIHFLDTDCSALGLAISMIALLSFTFLDYLEKSIFKVTGARFVKGKEPWNAWKRALKLYLDQPDGKQVPETCTSIVGGVR